MKNAETPKDSIPGYDDSWLTKDQVAKRLECSLPKITRYTKGGRLNPVVVDGRNRYNPDEINVILADPNRNRVTLEEKHEELAVYQLDTVRALVDLVRAPREAIDAYQERIIDRLMARCEELEKKLDAQRDATEAAKDQTHERQAVHAMIATDASIKKLAAEKMFNTIAQLINGSNASGVALTPDQLQELVLANDDGEGKFLTDEQVHRAKQVIAQHKAKTNGQGVVAGVKETAKQVIDAQGAS